jgi:hypothetical protein
MVIRHRKAIRRGLAFLVLAGTVFCATASTQAAERFLMRVERQASGVDAQGASIVKGRLIVNGQDFGETIENPSYTLEPGTFEGTIRYIFRRDLLLSSGMLAAIGDFLVAIDPAYQGSARRAHIVFHPGNLSSQSRGSILLAAPNQPLYLMRVALYGSAAPVTHPDRPVTVTIAQPRPSTGPPSAPRNLQVRVR